MDSRNCGMCEPCAQGDYEHCEHNGVPAEVQLTEKERVALDAFVSEHWAEFCKEARWHLQEDEIESLSDKLKG